MFFDRNRSALFALLLSGCSLGNVHQSDCTASSECREAFGFGFECGATGYCTELAVPDRCSTIYPTDLYDRPEQYADILVFGTLFDLSTDLDNLRSIELAFDEANIAGGLDGRDVGLVSCQYEADLSFDNVAPAEAAATSAAWLADSVGVEGIIGPAASQIVLDIWPVVSERDLFVISPSATSDELVEIDGLTSTDEEPGLFWRTAPNDSNQAGAIARDILARGQTRVAVISQIGAYGEGLAALLKPALNIPDERMFVFANSNQLTAAIADVSLIPDLEEVVFVSSDADDVVSFLNGANQLDGYDGRSIFLTDAARSAAVLSASQLASDLFPNIRGTNPVPDPRSIPQVDFYLAYSSRYGEDAAADSFNAFSYDAAWLALYASSWAIQQEGGLGGVNIARGMRQVSSGSSVPIRAVSWPDLITGPFADGTSINVTGASGDLDYDPVTGETEAPIAVWTINPGGTDFIDELVCYAAGGTCLPFNDP